MRRGATVMIELNTEVDLEVFRRYAGLSLPRHVSYPMPTWWQKLDATEVDALIQECRHANPPNALSLYLHIPFCEHLCKFCACTKVILRKSAPNAGSHVETYNDALITEIERLAEKVGSDRPLRQIHWGGGTPTYLEDDQIERIHRTIERAFRIEPDAEVAMEIDPRTVSPAKLKRLKDLGFNRVSFGVQDFNERVQTHVRRVQPFEMVRDTVQACRECGFTSVNFDLIYGLPYQTVETIRETVEQSISLSPDRVAYYHYAQIPEKIATQRGMDYTKLPSSEMKLETFLTGKRLFEEAGYEFIGLDHFAKASEMLGQAIEDGTIQRNFQGMTTGGGLRLLGVGASSISQLPDVGFLQNIKDHAEYVARIDADQSPVQRGMRFSFDDRVRQAVIADLYCTARLRCATIESRFDIDFADYFAREMTILRELEGDGLVTMDESGDFEVTRPLGRVLMRNVAAVFDAYLDPEAYRVGDAVRFSANA